MTEATVYECKIARVREVGESTKIVTPLDACEYWNRVIINRSWFQPDREQVVAIHLNCQNFVTGHHIVGIGTLNESIAHPRDVFATAICNSAHSIVLMHNHPSGNPQPSRADYELTKTVNNAGCLLMLYLEDHVIVGGDGQYFSFGECGLL